MPNNSHMSCRRGGDMGYCPHALGSFARTSVNTDGEAPNPGPCPHGYSMALLCSECNPTDPIPSTPINPSARKYALSANLSALEAIDNHIIDDFDQVWARRVL